MNSTIFWGLGSAVTWGIGDFCGGLATRRTSVWTVVLYSQAVGMVLLLALAFAFGETIPGGRDLFWGAVAGLATHAALQFDLRAATKSNYLK